jgi:hypothetical protein
LSDILTPTLLPKPVLAKLKDSSRTSFPLLWAFPCLFSSAFHLCLLLPCLYFPSHDYSFTSAILTQPVGLLTQPVLFLVTQGRYTSISSVVILCIPYALPTCSLPFVATWVYP